MTSSPQPTAPTPTAVPQPTTLPNLEEPKFGFNEFAERLNSRAAMAGFAAAVIIECVTGQGFLSWLGIGS